MFKNLKYLFFVIVIFSFGLFVYASSPFDITFPISELDNCADQAACKAYCDDLSHKDACLTFAEKHGFVSKERGEEVRERAKLIREVGGPGQCQSERECRAYCENPAHQGECFEFAEKYGFIPKEKVKLIKKVLEEGGPGGCRTEQECRSYCENPDNFKTCVKFAEEHGFLSKEEAQRIKKLPPVGPGGCRGEECRAYCENPDHQEECLKFAEEHDLIPKDELERAKRFIGKPGPGGCRGEECRVYCSDVSHQEECLKFAEEHDLIPKEELERAKKFMRVSREGGPGGCRGEECRTYCENPDRHGECFEFAKKNNLIPPEELERFEKGRGLTQKVKEIGGPGGCKSDEECRLYCSDANHVEECAAFAVTHGGFSQEEAKKMLREFTEHQRPQDFKKFEEEKFRRFEEFRELEQKFRGEQMTPMKQEGFPSGPGGCQGPEQCIKYCSDPVHRDECAKFNPSIGAPPPGEIFRQIEPGTESQYQQRLPETIKPGEIFPTAPPPPTSEYPAPIEEFSRPPEGTFCTQEYVPVCGFDHKTYSNACHAKVAGIGVAYPGECKKIDYQYPAPSLEPVCPLIPPQPVCPENTKPMPKYNDYKCIVGYECVSSFY